MGLSRSLALLKTLGHPGEMTRMSGSTVYGVILGILLATVSTMKNPAGSVILWSLLSAQSAIGAVIVWRRTGFRFFTAALVLGMGASALIAGLASHGLRLPFVPLAWNVGVVGLILSALLCLILESRRHPDEWRQWRKSAKQRTALDILLFRHIPSLRERDERSSGCK